MAYKVKFTQRFDKGDQQAFMALEQKFIELEKQDGGMPTGSRYVPIFGKEPTNTLIWEAEVPTLEDAVKLVGQIESNAGHDLLLEEQIGYIKDYYMEIWEKL